LLELRKRIQKVIATMDGNDDVEALIKSLISKPSDLKQICSDAGRGEPEPAEGRS
jgi:predicted component of type VI protein secretion system